MTEQRKFFRQSAHYFSGRIVLMLLGFVSFPIFTRVFTVAEYGILTLVSNVILIFTVFAKFGLQNTVQRFHHENAKSPDPAAFKRFYSTLFTGSFLLGVAAVSALILGAWLAPSSLLPDFGKKLLMLSAWIICFRAVRAMLVNMLQIEGRPLAYNAIEIANKVFTIGTICAFLFLWERTLRAFFLGTLLVEAATVLLSIPYLIKRNMLSLRAFDAASLRTSLNFAFPLLWAELAWVILDSGDRILVQRFLGSQALGYYAAAYGISSYVQDLLLAPLSLALFPLCMDLYLTRGISETQHFLSQGLKYFSIVAIAVFCLFAVSSNEAIVILASSKYREAHSLIPVLVAGMVISSVHAFFRVGLMIARKPAEVARITAIAGISNIGLNLFLLPRIGLQGAAIATLASYTIWVALTAHAANRAFPFKIQYASILRFLLAGVVAIVASSFVHFKNPWENLLVRSFTVAVLYAAMVLLFDGELRMKLRRLATEKFKPLASPEMKA